MNICSLTTLTLLLALNSMAFAEVYRCQTPEGGVVFSDKPLNLSEDCQRIKQEHSPDIYSNRPTQSRTPAPGKAKASKQKPSDKPVVKTQLELWTSRSETLVDDYNAAVKKRFHESFVLDKQKALLEINRIKEKKIALLEELEVSSLPGKDRQEIQDILREIP